MTVDLRLGDCLEVMTTLSENSVDTIITDPPYGLTFMGKDWDKGVPGSHFWKEALRVAKPGAILLAMGGTRTFHRLVVAIEDAGWEIRDTIAWIYGQGFPKSYNISKGIDKQVGAERIVVGDNPNFRPVSGKLGYLGEHNFRQTDGMSSITTPVTESAKLWEGYGTALKPAMELICVAMKPIEGTFVENALKWGVAGLNIDEGRVGIEGGTTKGNPPKGESNGIYGNGINGTCDIVDIGKGRFPANVIHDGSDEVVELFPDNTGQMVRGGYKPQAAKFNGNDYNNGEIYEGDKRMSREPIDMPGSAARFFKTIPDDKKSMWFHHKEADGSGIPQARTYADDGSTARFFYCAKASRSERNAGLEGMPDKERVDYGGFHSEQGLINNNRNPENRTPMKNGHPTVKPLALMRYLARLTKTPTGGVVLDPFLGSGTSGVASILEGRDFIGIELELDYMEIAKRRIEYAQEQKRLEMENK